MWSGKSLYRMDFRITIIIFLLMAVSLLVISSMTQESETFTFFTPLVRSQLQWFGIGLLVFFFLAGFDYHNFFSWASIFYIIMILLLIGVYLTKPIQSVHRWYRIPFLNMNIQPSEYTKIVLVLTLGWLLEKKGKWVGDKTTSIQVLFLVGIPFFLILKQPDLGTALVLYPIMFTMCYFAGVNKITLRLMSILGIIALFFVSLMFLGFLSHEKMKPMVTCFLKEYQYERLNPDTYHQKAAQISIALGGAKGEGWHKSSFAGRKWLPAAHTDSVFAAYGEEFGFIGVLFLLFLFYSLIYCSFQVVAVAKDSFGKFLSSGIAVYLAMHIIVNIAMMCGFLPITGVPLLLMSYGGNSVVTTMASLGILQSIYTRRFMF
ncbi:MAG: FtsW/RodA/SpoVE family cell cycle protein [Chlamydiota bacterium]